MSRSKAEKRDVSLAQEYIPPFGTYNAIRDNTDKDDSGHQDLLFFGEANGYNMHRSGNNILFADGHVQVFPATTRTPSPTARVVSARDSQYKFLASEEREANGEVKMRNAERRQVATSASLFSIPHSSFNSPRPHLLQIPSADFQALERIAIADVLLDEQMLDAG